MNAIPDTLKYGHVPPLTEEQLKALRTTRQKGQDAIKSSSELKRLELKRHRLTMLAIQLINRLAKYEPEEAHKLLDQVANKV